MRSILLSLLLVVHLQLSADSTSVLEKHPALKGASIAYQVKDAATGDVLMEHNPDLALAPASVMKLFTTAIALDQLGGDFRAESRVYFDGPVNGNVLEGNIIYDPNYDPSVGNKRFKNEVSFIVKQIRVLLSSKGIKKVKGGLKVLERANVAEQIPRTWIWEDMGNYFGASCGSTILNENVMELHFKSGKAGQPTEIKEVVPNLPYVTIENHVKGSKVRKDLAYAFGAPGSNKVVVTGTIPMNRGDFVVLAALPDPARALAQQLDKGLRNMGLDLKSEYGVINELSSSAEQQKKYGGETIKRLVKLTNLNSINVFAEALLNIAYAKSGSAEPKAKWMKTTLSKYISTDGMQIHDGSGLSRFNTVTVNQMTSLLKWMAGHQEGMNFKRSWAVAGNSGTLKYFLKNTDAIGKFKGKSGSMTGVRSYCGSLMAKSGKELHLAVMVNNYNMSGSTLKLILEQWVNDVYSAN